MFNISEKARFRNGILGYQIYTQWRFWSDRANPKADLNRWRDHIFKSTFSKVAHFTSLITVNTRYDCKDLYNHGETTSGTYTIRPCDICPEMTVYCDMTTNGGGWLVSCIVKLEVYGPVNTIKVMSSWTVNVFTPFLDRLSLLSCSPVFVHILSPVNDNSPSNQRKVANEFRAG